VPLRQPELPPHDARAQAALKAVMAEPATSDPIDWGVGALAVQLAPLLPGLSIEVLAQTDSTNTRLLERARSDPSPKLLVAALQTAGRGRHGRPWLALAGASLTFSLALPLAPKSWSGLSLAVGVALARALDGDTAVAGSPQPSIGLKWPNDLQIGGRKLGGILIETVVHGDQRIVVVGIGLNLRAVPLAGTAALDEIDPLLADGPAVLARVAVPLVQALRAFEAHGFEPVAAAYAARDVLRGHPVRTTAPGAAEGIAEGVDGDGALCLRSGSTVVRVTSGEASVRRAGTEAAPC
jgi:BirA family transcriptional regulator, biotin operon repressor / biotin---[acetyl-CoA-carboxylase] ligase